MFGIKQDILVGTWGAVCGKVRRTPVAVDNSDDAGNGIVKIFVYLAGAIAINIGFF